MKPNIIIISGPTATGKTDLSIEVVKHLKHNNIDSNIINFDSLLFYKDLNIGTAKPTKEEQKNIEHHLIDICEVYENFDASLFSAKASEIINRNISNNNVSILVGGSGFYLKALIKGMIQSKESDQKVREQTQTLYQEQGIGPILSYLRLHDPESYKTLHENDHYRLMRAYEYHMSFQQPISKEKARLDELEPYNFSRPREKHWNLLHIYLNIPKEEHYPIMLQRVDKMLNRGLLDEVQKIVSEHGEDHKSLQSIGYKETIQYLSNKDETLEKLKDNIFISTRQLAKAQRTFFKKVGPKFEFNPLNDKEKIMNLINENF